MLFYLNFKPFLVSSPGPTNSSVQGLSSLQGLSTLGSLGSLGNGGGLQALSRVQPPLTPSLTPSLANHYREDLTQHVRAFPADILEKQVLDSNSVFFFCRKNGLYVVSWINYKFVLFGRGFRRKSLAKKRIQWAVYNAHAYPQS